MQKSGIRFLGWKDPLEKELATHSSILAWRIPWTEEPGRVQSMGSQRIGHDLATEERERFKLRKNSILGVCDSAELHIMEF